MAIRRELEDASRQQLDIRRLLDHPTNVIGRPATVGRYKAQDVTVITHTRKTRCRFALRGRRRCCVVLADVAHHHHECGGDLVAVTYFATDYPGARGRIIGHPVATGAPVLSETEGSSRGIFVTPHSRLDTGSGGFIDVGRAATGRR